MADTETETLATTARTLAGYDFKPDDVPAIVQTPGGGLFRVPARMVGRAASEGLTALSPEQLAQREARAAARRDQEGIGAAIATGVESSLGALTFGATDWALKKTVSALAGISEEEYLRLREARMEASPIAATVGEVAGIAVPALATAGGALAATPVGAAMAAGRAAAGAVEAGAIGRTLASAALGARSPAMRLAASSVAAVAPKIVGGAVEGALWGAGTGVRESILGKTDNVSEAVLSHMGTDALLFGTLGGGLGVIEAGLPSALAGAKKAANAAYERLPFFGRRALTEAAVAAPSETGIAAETARALYREREALVALDGKLKGALDTLATSAPEKIDQVVARIAEVEQLGAVAADPKKMLAAIIAAPREQAEAVLSNVAGMQRLMGASETALADTLAAPVDQLSAIVANAERVAELEEALPGTLRTLLSAPADQSVAALTNVDGLLALETQAKGSINRILSAPADRVAAAMANADGITQLEAVKRGALKTILEAPAERSIAALRNVDGLATLQREAPGDALAAILEADAGAADAILGNASGVASLERANAGSLRSLLDAAPDRAALVAQHADGLAMLEREANGTLRHLLDVATPEEAEFFATRAQRIAELEVGVKGASGVLREATAEQGDWMLSRAADLVEMNRELPDSLNAFRAFVTGPTGTWSRAEADNLLNNWRMIMRNPNERARIVAQVIEDKTAQYEAGERLMHELNTAAKADRKTMLRAIGEPGGPPTLEGVQKALADVTATTTETAQKMLGDSLVYNEAVAKDIAGLAQRMQNELIGLTPQRATESISRAREILSDPYEAFERLSAMRSDVGEAIGELKKKSGLSEKNALREVKKLYGAISDVFRNAKVWGEAAKIRAELDELQHAWISATGRGSILRQEFMKESVIDGQKTLRISTKKVNEWVNQIGDARTEAQAFSGKSRTEAFHELTNLVERMIDVGTRAVPSIAKGTVDVGEAEIRSLVQRSVQASADLEQRALYSRIYNQISAKAGEAIPNTLGFRTGSANLGGYGHGMPTAGTTGYAVTPTGRLSVADLAARDAARSAAAQSRAVAAEQEAIRATERLADLSRRQQTLTEASKILQSAPTRVVLPVEAEAAVAIPGVAETAAGATRATVESAPVVGKAAVGIFDVARAIPRHQWQVTARVRGMVAAEKRGAELLARIETGAKALLKVGKVARYAAGKAVETEQPRGVRARAERRDQTAARMRRVVELDRSVDAFMQHADAQGFAVAGELPEMATAMSAKMRAAVAVLAEAVPAQPDRQLDRQEFSPADIARFERRAAVLNRPTALLDRARDGTITAEEVEAVERVVPTVLAQMRASVQAEVTDAQARGVTLPRQRVQAIETLLGYRLTSEGANQAAAQAVFSGARRGETAKADTVRPLPGAANVTLGNRYMTPQQAAGARV